ncbi:MAG: LD-carboxypeptidase, partial [Bacteroidetes bacterium]
MNDNEIPFGKTAEQIIQEAVKKYDYPVCFGFPAGHIDNNMPLIMGAEVRLEVAEKSHIIFME